MTLQLRRDTATNIAGVTPADGEPLWTTDTHVLAIGQGGTQYTINAAFPLTTKGDIYTYDTAGQRLAVGTNGQVLTADSAQATGIKWATPTTGTVTSITLTQPAAGLTITNSGVAITTSGTRTFALANDLAAIEALSGTNTIYYRSGTDTWSAVTVGSGLGFTSGTLAATGGAGSPLTTKGDVYCYSTTNDRLPIGSNNMLLMANSGASTGLQWTNSPTVASLTSTGGITANGITSTNSAVINADTGVSGGTAVNPILVTSLGATCTSQTAGNGFGATLGLYAQDSSGSILAIGDLTWTWVSATHASRKGRVVHNIYDASGSAQEVFREEWDGSASRLGFFGSSAVVQQSGDVGTGLVNLGLFSGTPTYAGANVTGTVSSATTATNATNTAITDDTSTNATMYPTWVTTTSGNLPQKISSTKLTFNPSTATLTTTTFAGALSGNASTASSAAKLTTARNINGVAFDGTADITITAAAGTLTGTTLNSAVVTSSLTSVGTLTGLTILKAIAASGSASTETTFGRNSSSGTPSDGYGSILKLQLQSNNISDRDAADITYTWATSADASRKARVVHNVYDTAIREALRLEASGSASMIGFLGAAATAAQASPDIGSDYVTRGLATGTPTFAGANVTGTVASATSASSATTATTATNATNTGITDDHATNATMYLTWVTSTSGNLPQKISSTNLTFNPSTGTLTTTTVAAALSGNATTATTLATARAINGVNFDGSGAITVTAAAGTLTGATLNSGVTASSLTSVGTLSVLTVKVSDSATNATSTMITLGHNTSGTAAAGFGSVTAFQLQDSTTADTSAADITTTWATATHASRKARVVHNVYDTAARECLRIEASGSAAMIGFLGASASAALSSPDLGTLATTFGLATGTPTFGAANLTGSIAAGRMPALTGDVTSSAGAVATTVAAISTAGINRGYIDGLILSNNATANALDMAAGCARDDGDAVTIYNSSAITAKALQTSGAWAAGSSANGLDTGAAAASTTYHIWLISKAAGANPDILFSLSASSPTMPSTYTLKRLIGSLRTDGSKNWYGFVQNGDIFTLKTQVNDISAANPGTSAVTRTMTSIPTGLKLEAILGVGAGAVTPATDNAAGIIVTDLAGSDVAPSSTLFSFIAYSSPANIGGYMRVFTNTSAQVRSRVQVSTANTTLVITSIGWIHHRGKNQ